MALELTTPVPAGETGALSIQCRVFYIGVATQLHVRPTEQKPDKSNRLNIVTLDNINEERYDIDS